MMEIEAHIYFEEREIGILLLEILTARGVDVTLLDSRAQLANAQNVITEPQFFEELNQSQKERCLIIGNKASLGNMNALAIERPLTEKKIEMALELFIEAAKSKT